MIDLFLTSLWAVKAYVTKRISNKLDREAYETTMEIIENRAEKVRQGEYADEVALGRLLYQLDYYRDSFPWQLRASMIREVGLHKPQAKYRNLAYEHALELAISLNKRFIEGGTGEGVLFLSPKQKKFLEREWQRQSN